MKFSKLEFLPKYFEQTVFYLKKIVWFPGSTTYHERDGSETSSQFKGWLQREQRFAERSHIGIKSKRYKLLIVEQQGEILC